VTRIETVAIHNMCILSVIDVNESNFFCKITNNDNNNNNNNNNNNLTIKMYIEI